MAKTKTWVWVAVGVAGLALLAFIALIAAGMVFVARQVETEAASPSSAEQTFAAVRERFKGQQPVIKIEGTERDPRVRVDLDRSRPADAARPETMHVMAFDPDDERIVRISLPFWLLRFGGRGKLNLGGSGIRFDFERVDLTVEDLENLGPALILDQQMPHGERVLVWTQ